MKVENEELGTSLVVQWLRLNSQCGDWALLPGLGTRSHTLELRACMPQLKILRAATKTWRSPINKYTFFFLMKNCSRLKETKET